MKKLVLVSLKTFAFFVGWAICASILPIPDTKSAAVWRFWAELLCMNLEAAGYETVAAYDGEEAQRLLLWQEDADLAVVDIMLPGKDGFALMEDFKKKELPVLYLTAKDDVASKVKGLKLGAEDYMVKPFEMLELLVRIEKVQERTGRAKDAFYMVDKSRSRKEGGSGLGLALCVKVAEIHGGCLKIESRQREGTTVRAIF